MNAYEEKRAARAVRLRARAVKLDAEGTALWRKDDKLIACMAGSPVLVGHHSERRHRRDLDRIDSHRRKAIELKDEAATCARRADAAESNDSISSDDPEAITKLKAKVAELTDQATRAKLANRIIGKRRDADSIRSAFEAAAAKGVDLARIPVDRFCLPDINGHFGVPGYRLRNWASEVRRLNGRIVELERKAAETKRAPETFGDVTVSHSQEDNRVRLTFPGKPAPTVIALLKSRGFRWSPSATAWQRQATDNAWRDARDVARTATKN